MAISPNQQEKLAIALRRLYAEAETVILEKIAKRIAGGIDEPGWQEKKLAQIRKQREEIERVIRGLQNKAPGLVENVIQQAFVAGITSADEDLAELTEEAENPEDILVEEVTQEAFGAVHEQAIQALVESTISKLQGTHLQILRSADDTYREIIAEVSRMAVVGVETRRQIAQRALNQFADRGVKVFQDKKGRVWDIASYAEMATRAAIGQAAINGHLMRIQEQGRDLVIVSDHPEECQTCRPWEGKVLSISGNTPGYPTVAQARSAGLWHPGCGHTVGAWIPGLSRPIHAEGDPKGYELRQKQRYMERQVRHWKRRLAVAITEEDQRKASAKVRQWQAALREFVEEHERRRKYERESITAAR